VAGQNETDKGRARKKEYLSVSITAIRRNAKPKKEINPPAIAEEKRRRGSTLKRPTAGLKGKRGKNLSKFQIKQKKSGFSSGGDGF